MSKESYEKKLVVPNCQSLLLGENHWNKRVTAKVCLIWYQLLGKNYTGIKTGQLNFASKNSSEMFWKKTSFETEHLSQTFDNKSWY